MSVVFMSAWAGVVTAQSATQADSDPMPGFGVLIAITAIVIAGIIAHRKRKQYLSE